VAASAAGSEPPFYKHFTEIKMAVQADEEEAGAWGGWWVKEKMPEKGAKNKWFKGFRFSPTPPSDGMSSRATCAIKGK